MAKSKGRAGKRATTTGRGRSRTRKSGTRKPVGSGSRKRKPAQPAAHKRKASPSSEQPNLERLLQTARLQQQASAEILRAVASAAGDAAGPLQLIAETTARLFGAASVSIQLAEGGEFTQEYRVGAIAQRIGSAYPRSNIRVGGRNLPGTVVAENRQIHIPDLDHLDPSMSDFPGLPHARAGGARTVCGTPLRREGKAIGVLIVFRDRLLPFTDDELDLQQSFADQAVIAIENARLFNEVQARTRDLSESLQHQTATADVLKVISRSVFDLQAVLDTLVQSAYRLCGANLGLLYLKGDDAFECKAIAGPGVEEASRYFKGRPIRAGRATSAERVIATGQVQSITDFFSDPEFDPNAKEIIRNAGHSGLGLLRSTLAVPMMRDNAVIGVLVIASPQTGPFPSRQVELLRTFADQAVIAIENARLFNETEEALERQTATSEILRAISRSPTDVKPVFEAIAQTAVRLLGCDRSFIQRCDRKNFWSVAWCGPDGQLPMLNTSPVPIDPSANFPSRAIVEKKTLHLPDWSTIELPEFERSIRDRLGINSALYLPLLRDGECIGLLAMAGKRANVFDAKDILLAESFRDQALIAIENTRLFNETREALERQTATADILKVIASSPSDLQPVFAAIAERSNQLLDGHSTAVWRLVGDMMHLVAFTSTDLAGDDALQRLSPIRLDLFPALEKVREGEVLELTDTEDIRVAVSDYARDRIREVSRARGFRSQLFVPLFNDQGTIGLISVTRKEPGGFVPQHVQLLQTFADQAVIAIQNVELFNEVQAKTRDLTEALQQQTATADVLKIISRSAFDLQAVFETLTSSAVDLLGVHSGTICVRDGEVFRYRSAAGAYWTEELWRYLQQHPVTPGRNTAAGRVIQSGHIEQIPDILDDPEYAIPMQALNPGHTPRAILSVPLLGKDKVEGAMVLSRQEPGPFAQREIDILQTFADQAVIAIENARLFDEVQARTRELSRSLDDLRAAQDRLIQTEKLASLGQLTAGIAHEIKNPLNFVNNFSALSVELTDELNELLAPAELAGKLRQEIGELTALLKDNLAKVVQHGKRADSIVKNMLLHSREGSGERRSADINALVAESLSLAYHGARAERAGFNITLSHDLDPEAGALELYPQEMTRALLNLISNGFYAATRRKIEAGDKGFEPLLTAATRNLGKTVEIRIRDNGTGMAPDVKEKIFNPFFTTKPTGEGTGLGLSMTHDIVVKQHGGRIDVETEPGEFTEFIITLPRDNGIAGDEKAG